VVGPLVSSFEVPSINEKTFGSNLLLLLSIESNKLPKVLSFNSLLS
jgi:hypothetical protein